MPRLTKIAVIVGAIAVIVVGATIYKNVSTFDGQNLNAQQAYEQVSTQKIILVDIRRPDEWKNTGVAKGAVTIDMRSKRFISTLKALLEEHKKPVALICAKGIRSARLAKRLAEVGINVINVPEGMLGNHEGPGWIKRQLPVEQYG